MTGGKAFTVFLIAALVVPIALFAVISFGGRHAPAVQRWYSRHARGLNWTFAAFFAVMAVVTVLRPEPDQRDPIWRLFGPTGARMLVLGVFIFNAVDHSKRALRAGRHAA